MKNDRMENKMNKNLLYRSIPKVDVLLTDEGIKVLIGRYSRESVMEAIHIEMEKLRAFIGRCEDEESAKQQIALLNENNALLFFPPPDYTPD